MSWTGRNWGLGLRTTSPKPEGRPAIALLESHRTSYATLRSVTQTKSSNINMIHDDTKDALQTQEAKRLASPGQPDLPYAQVTDVSFWFFVKESFLFSVNYLMDRMTFMITFVLFRLGGFTQGIAVLGLVIVAVDLFFCISRDFQEAVGIVLGPYYSKGDSKNYYFYLLILIFWNVAFFLACLPFVFFQAQFFGLLGVNPGLIGQTVAATQGYMLSACAFLSASNFVKGRPDGPTRRLTHRARQHQAAPKVQRLVDNAGHGRLQRHVWRADPVARAALPGIQRGVYGQVHHRNRFQLGLDFQIRWDLALDPLRVDMRLTAKTRTRSAARWDRSGTSLCGTGCAAFGTR